MTYWSSDADTGDYSRTTDVRNYGTDFRISGDLNSINFDTNLFDQKTCNDYTCGQWAKYVRNDVHYTKHGGILGDGHCNAGDQWMWTLDTEDERFKNDRSYKMTTIYMR